MNVKSHVFEGPPIRDADRPALKMTAKQYTTVTSTIDVDGLTLLFAHCVGAHKEQWEPVIELLFEAQAEKVAAHRIREAWAFDWQNHGDAAVLNREALKNRPEGVSAFEWSAALAAFVQSPHMLGHRIVLVGHSAGATAMMLTTQTISPAVLHQYTAMILVESTMVTREVFNSELEDRMSTMEFAVATTAMRRDRWRSRAAAQAYFAKRLPWEMWDARILGIMVEYGLESDPAEDGVRLKCDRAQESVSFPDVEPHFEGALQLSRICHSLPVHLIWGTRNDLVPEFIQDSLSDVSEGRVVASVTKVQDAGHMILQEQPDSLARAIMDILNGSSLVARPKL